MKRTLLSSIFFCTFAGIFSNVALAQSAQAQVVQDSRIPELLKLKSQMTVNDELADRYKIQLFYGQITEANKVQDEYKSKYAQWEPKIVYESPNYKVWVGNFRNRLEADRALLKIKENFPSAFVMKPER